MPEPTDAPTRKPKGDVPRCKCGHDKAHHMVSASLEYTFWGWVLSLIGISAVPRAVNYVCRRCEQRVERSTDPQVIAETPLWG